MAQCPISAQQLGGMLQRIADGTISNSGAKEVFRTMWSAGGGADEIIEAKGLKQVSDSGVIEAIVDEIIAANAEKWRNIAAEKINYSVFCGLSDES